MISLFLLFMSQNNSMLWMNLNDTWNLPSSQMLMMSLCIGALLPPFSRSGGRNWAGNWWLILTPSQLLTVSRSARCCGPLGTACMALPKMWLQIPTVQYSNRVTEWNIHKLTLYFNVFPMEKECKKGYQGYACLKPFNSSPFDHDSVV